VQGVAEAEHVQAERHTSGVVAAASPCAAAPRLPVLTQLLTGGPMPRRLLVGQIPGGPSFESGWISK